MNTKSTDEVLKILNSVNSVSELNQLSQEVKEMNPTLSFAKYIEEHMLSSGITASQLIQKAQIQRNYGYQILNGTKNPGRDKVLSICLALSFDLKETQRALTLAKEAVLYPKCRRDSALIFCINKNLSVMETNELLFNIEEDILN